MLTQMLPRQWQDRWLCSRVLGLPQQLSQLYANAGVFSAVPVLPDRPHTRRAQLHYNCRILHCRLVPQILHVIRVKQNASTSIRSPPRAHLHSSVKMLHRPRPCMDLTLHRKLEAIKATPESSTWMLLITERVQGLRSTVERDCQGSVCTCSHIRPQPFMKLRARPTLNRWELTSHPQGLQEGRFAGLQVPGAANLSKCACVCVCIWLMIWGAGLH